MDLTGIISIAGKPGLFQVVSQSKNGIIVSSIEDGKKFPISAAQRVSALSDISMYTYNEDLPLVEVFEKIYIETDGKVAIDHKSKPEELRNFLESCVPDFDQERVYNSDLKKLFQWYNLLVSNNILDFTKEEGEGEGEKETVKEISGETNKKDTDKPKAVKK